MKIRTSFRKGQRYGADDINKITARLITSGIVPQYISDSINLKKHNSYRFNHNTSMLKSYDENELIIDEPVARIENSKVIFPTIKAVFDNGTVTENTEETIFELKDGNIYYQSNRDENTEDTRRFTQELPDTENIVHLGVVKDSIVTTKHPYAKGRIAGNNTKTLKTMEYSFSLASGTNYIDIDLGVEELAFVAFLAGDIYAVIECSDKPFLLDNGFCSHYGNYGSLYTNLSDLCLIGYADYGDYINDADVLEVRKKSGTTWTFAINSNYSDIFNVTMLYV